MDWSELAECLYRFFRADGGDSVIRICAYWYGSNRLVIVGRVLESVNEESLGHRLVEEERLEKVAAAHLEVVDLFL